MITGTHVIIYTKDAEADRAFFRDVLGFRSVDEGQGWLIFALPPSEAAFHPADQNGAHEIYLMCDDLAARGATDHFPVHVPSSGDEATCIERSIRAGSVVIGCAFVPEKVEEALHSR